MPTRYVLLSIHVPEEHTDAAMTALNLYPIQGVEMGMDSMVVCFEQNDWQEAYAESIVNDMQAYGAKAEVTEVGTEEDQNWNAEWEASIDPVIVNSRIAIVPEWRVNDVDAPLKLVITPKMSFGTGHHATTRMMCRLVEEFVAPDSVWVDIGTGTGVLAVLAVKLGAKSVLAFDNNEWSILNAQENIVRNGCEGAIRLEQSDLDSMTLPECDGIAANLYRHLVIPNAHRFVQSVKPGGVILVSGILIYDKDEVVAPFVKLGCEISSYLEEGEWCAVAFRRPL
jgi:ribosomal protein L11 methyltransferase